jgi:hypothetical protein
MHRNYQDSWILEGVFLPFVCFVIAFLIVLWFENDNKWVAIICAWTVIVILLVPSLKYEQVYGQSIDSVIHYQMIKDLMVSGRVSPQSTYQAVAGMHSWLASLGITSGLSPSDIVKYGFPLTGGIMPLLLYFICVRIRIPTDISKYIISLSCLATYPYHQISGTGFTLIPLVLLLIILLVREYYCTSLPEKSTYTVLALILLFQLVVWHTTTPILLVALLVILSFTPVLIRLITGIKSKVNFTFHYLEISLLAAVLVLGYHSIMSDPVFLLSISRISSLFVVSWSPATVLPTSLHRITLLDTLKVFILMYGPEAILFILVVIGLFAFWRDRIIFLPYTYLYAYLIMILLAFFVFIPSSVLGIDIERFMWIPITISPFFGGITLWWLNKKTQMIRIVYRHIIRGIGFLLILASLCIFTMEFYSYQPLVPKSVSLAPSTPDEYVVWLHQVNTAYQQNMIAFAETYSVPGKLFDIDLLGSRQYTRYFGGARTRGLYLPLHPMFMWDDPINAPKDRLFLLHWPGRAGGYGEQVQYRSVANLTLLRNTIGWGLIYDNGESFILLEQ